MSIRFYVPDWDDRVDPGFNFIADEHTPGRNPYRDDRYAHEIYPSAPYDGVLLSLATLDENPNKRAAILEAGTVHRYFRLPQDGDHTVLGDCGAFTYWRAEVPPYSTEQVLETYQALGFDLGVSIDHLIVTEVEAEKERRWQITVTNAEEFLTLHRSGGYSFTPVGVAQGWDPPSYQRAVAALVKIGYRYIAIGGLVRSRTEDILRTLVAIQPELPSGMQVHLFGVNRPEYVYTFAGLGVTSFDSASRLRRAWMDGRHNYFLGEDAYTAIRIPEARALARKYNLNEEQAIALEERALKMVRHYATGLGSLHDAHAAVLDYDRVAAGPKLSTQRDYERTLLERPWEQCPCTICRQIGVEVLIFRGNNRNRRRGFHNVWQLYRQLHGSVGEGDLGLQRELLSRPVQLEFSL